MEECATLNSQFKLSFNYVVWLTNFNLLFRLQLNLIELTHLFISLPKNENYWLLVLELGSRLVLVQGQL